jgi:hypothetical protein
MFANGRFPEASARADYSTLNVFLMKNSVTHTMRTVISNTGGSEQHYTAGAVLHKVHRLLQLVNNRLNYSWRATFQRMEKSTYQFAGESSFGEGISRAHLGKKSQKEISGYGTMGAFLEIRYS